VSRQVTPEVIAELIRDVQKNELHGELTITFNAGRITLVKDTFTHKPDAILEAYADRVEERKRQKVLVVRKKGTADTGESAAEKSGVDNGEDRP
jgi:hypothetical protein